MLHVDKSNGIFSIVPEGMLNIQPESTVGESPFSEETWMNNLAESGEIPATLP